MPATARTPLGVAAVACLALAAGPARAEETEQFTGPSRVDGWRAGGIATAGVSSDLDVVGTLGVGVYPWRSTGFELRLVYTGAMVGSYSIEYPTGAVVMGSGPGHLRVVGVTKEVALVTRHDGFEPWVAVGAWSGSASAERDGFSGTGACQMVCQGLATSSPGSKSKVSLGTRPAVGVGLRYQHTWLLLGLEARHVFFGQQAVRVEAVGLDVPLRADFIGFSIGFAFWGPVERGE